jgi:hypothetical protein
VNGIYFLACVFVSFKTMTKNKMKGCKFNEAIFSLPLLIYLCVEGVNKTGALKMSIQKISKVLLRKLTFLSFV